MTRVRRALGSVAVAWLLCQTATLAITPVVAWFGTTGALTECTCIHGTDAACPMHHPKAATGSRSCTMRSTNDHGTAIASVFGLLGFLPDNAPEAVLASSVRMMPLDQSIDFERPAPPDPPPPRT